MDLITMRDGSEKIVSAIEARAAELRTAQNEFAAAVDADDKDAALTAVDRMDHIARRLMKAITADPGREDEAIA